MILANNILKKTWGIAVVPGGTEENQEILSVIADYLIYGCIYINNTVLYVQHFVSC
jgi:hypothetical protein